MNDKLPNEHISYPQHFALMLNDTMKNFLANTWRTYFETLYKFNGQHNKK